MPRQRYTKCFPPLEELNTSPKPAFRAKAKVRPDDQTNLWPRYNKQYSFAKKKKNDNPTDFGSRISVTDTTVLRPKMPPQSDQGYGAIVGPRLRCHKVHFWGPFSAVARGHSHKTDRPPYSFAVLTFWCCFNLAIRIRNGIVSCVKQIPQIQSHSRELLEPGGEERGTPLRTVALFMSAPSVSISQHQFLCFGVQLLN